MYEINYMRAAAGFALASTFAVVAISINLVGFALPVIIIGLILALFVGSFFVFPFYSLCKNLGQLKIWWAIALGGLAAALPFLIVVLYGMLGDTTGSSRADGVWYKIDGSYTRAGWHSLAFVTATIFSCGAIGALIGWIVSFGFCTEPPRINSEQQVNED